jgi:hypothetical protein
MGTETNLPPMVHLYLELISKLIVCNCNDLDSTTNESILLRNEMSFYLKLVRNEMAKAALEGKNHDRRETRACR